MSNSPELETKDFEKDPEFQKRLDAITAGLKLKREDETCTPVKDEEETQEESKPETKNDKTGFIEILEEFGIDEKHIKLYLALLVRNKDFYEKFGSLFKPYDFASITPEAPHEVLETIFTKADEYYKKYKSLPDKDILKDEIAAHFKQFKKDQKKLPEWYAVVDEIFDSEDLESKKDYYVDQLTEFLQIQELKLTFGQTLEKFDRPIPLGGVATILRDMAKRCLEAAEIGVKNQGKAAIDIDEFSKIQFPSRKIIINPWLQEGSIGMIDGQAGVGKTFFGITCCTGSTSQTLVGNWEVINPIPCIYVDGEMDYRDMQERFRDLGTGKRLKNLRIICDSYNVLRNAPRIFNLTDPNQRAALFNLCQKDKDPNIGLLLWLDNISCLFPGLEENAKKDWDAINMWQLDLKKSGVSTYDFHHQGKSGDQRGTSGRLDNIDTSIKLSLPRDYKTQDGCRFNVHFKKKRVKDAGLYLIKDQQWQLATNEGSPEWIITTSTKKSKEEIFLMLAQGVSNRQVAKNLGVNHSYVNKIKIKLTADGYFHMDGKLTEKGTQRLESATKDEDSEDE